MRLIGKALVSKLFLFVVDLKLMAVADVDTGVLVRPWKPYVCGS